MDSATRLQKILVDSPVGVVLPAIALLNLPDWWLAGGAVRNTVWRSLFGDNCQLLINDFDIAIFERMIGIGDTREEEFLSRVSPSMYRT
ncbi:nucleotidyltransferase family protein [Trichocoleus sp. Lan]